MERINRVDMDGRPDRGRAAVDVLNVGLNSGYFVGSARVARFQERAEVDDIVI